ncbi:3'-5'-exoribonuclease [Aureococcus anophagefferens]|nr:3'-5'-exoribonuclease [Aureococcus anophagefferens]
MRTAALLLLWSTMHCLALRLPWQVWRTLATPRPGTSAPGRAVDAFLAERAPRPSPSRDGGEEVKALAFGVDGGGSVVAVVLASDSVDPRRSRGASARAARGSRRRPTCRRVGFGVGSAIVGATLERAKGTEQVRNAIRRLRCGQRVVVSGTPTWADGPALGAVARKRRQLRDGQLDFRCDELEVLGSKAPPKPRRKLSPRRAADKALPVLSMPADVRVARVDDAASAAAFASDVGGRGDDVVGVDAEWEPETDGPAAVLQVATRAAVYVVDLVALDGEALTVVGAALDAVLEKAVVVGFAVGNDLERAAAAHPALAGLRNATTRELRDYAGSSSLSGLAGALLGVRLDKRLQCSAWGVGARPLPDAWVAYAALDAYVCVLLHDSLADRGSDAVAALDVSAAAPRAGDLSAVDDPERTSALLGRGRQRVNHPKDDALTFVAGTDGALSGYDKRSGVVRLRDCSVFFVNWDPPKPNRRVGTSTASIPTR